MKTLKIYLTVLIVALIATMGTPASAQVLRDANFNSIGRINGNGMVRDTKSYSIGRFDADGTVHSKSGDVVGSIKRMEIFDNEHNRIGYINNDGTVRDGDSNVIGHINLSDGKVSDAEHNTIGFARGIRVDWIACYYFFHFFDN